MEIIKISIISYPSLVIFNTGMVVLIDFIEISIKSTRMIPTNTSIIEPIKGQVLHQ